MQCVWILLFVCGLLFLAWRVGMGERKAGPVPPPVYSDDKPEPPRGNAGWGQGRKLRWKAEEEGLYGELLLVDQLTHALDPARFAVIHDVWLHVQRSGTTQIDCIVVSEGGVFVIEVKNWECLVDGSAKAAKWRFIYGHEVQIHGNPRLQNQGHIADLRENFGWDVGWQFRSIVAYSDKANFAHPLPPDVMHFSEVPTYIQRIAAQGGGRRRDGNPPEVRRGHTRRTGGPLRKPSRALGA